MAAGATSTSEAAARLLLLLLLPPSLDGLSIVSSCPGVLGSDNYRKCFCDEGGSFVCDLFDSHALPNRLARLAADRYNVERGSPARSYELRGVIAAQEILCSAREANAMDCCERAFFGGLIPWKAQMDTNAPSNYHFTFELTEYPSKLVGKCKAHISFPRLPGKAMRADLLACDFPRGSDAGPIPVKDDDAAGSISLRDALEKLGTKPPAVIGSVFPDSFGNVLSVLKPFWRLAKIGGSVVNLERGDVSSKVTLAQVRSVQQVPESDPESDPQGDPKGDHKGDPKGLQFQFLVLMHELPSQEIIPCSMLIGWREGQKVAVRFNCSEPACLAPAPEDGSGAGQG